MKYLFYIVIGALFIVQCSGLQAQMKRRQLITTGYKNGTLIVIGGGKLDSSIFMEFKKYAGGDSAKIIVIPTALDDDYLLQDSSYYFIEKSFESHGFKDITIMHTRDTAIANTDEFIEPLKTATGLYFLGGRQWRIADGFLGTKAHDEMFKLLDRGGVIAGSSAGATIQGSYLARGDTENNQTMLGNHEEGLGFITNIAIDQHVLARNRQFDMFDILMQKPELLGIGIDENTAIVVKGDEFEVIGASYVLVYDGSFWSLEGSDLKNLPNEDAIFYMLKEGDRYNLKDRKVILE
ncbi:MAG: cyanophycinase [Bacteroidetes bacterium]|nr:cyanophycinase [Bacteroidota bacterium]